jgi:hypothetical protein
MIFPLNRLPGNSTTMTSMGPTDMTILLRRRELLVRSVCGYEVRPLFTRTG